MGQTQTERLRIIVQALVAKGKLWLALQAIWIHIRVQMLVASKKRHNRRQEKLLRQSIRINTDIQVELGIFDLEDL